MKIKSVYDKMNESLDNTDYSLEIGNISGIDESMTDEDIRKREAFEAVGKQYKSIMQRSGKRKHPGVKCEIL